MHWEEIWTSPAAGARTIRTLLTPASWLYAAGWQSYLAMYRLGVKKAAEPHSPIVCVGNLLAGGTGKTPTTLHIADLLLQLGKEVVIGCSGYGSPASEAAKIAPAGALKASQWGDEAALMRWLRPEIPLIVGRRRVFAAELCARDFPEAALLMDDGFQHLPLKKHLSIVLDPPQPNRHCLPGGPYREPAGNRTRADVVIPDEFRIVTAPPSFQNPDGHPVEIPGHATVLCALGRPKVFLEALAAAGVEIARAETRPDHDPLTAGNLLSDLAAGGPIVVSGKDWVKLRDREDVGRYDIVIASHEVTIEPRDEFRNWLQAKLNGIPTKRS